MVAYLFELSYTGVIVTLLVLYLRFIASFSTKKRFFASYLFGFAVNVYGLSWLYTVYPLSWMENKVSQLAGITLLILSLSLSTACAYLVLPFAFHKKLHLQARPFAFALLLTLAEVIRSLIISTLYYGNHSTIALHFTAGTIGNALSTTPLVELAYLGGVFALTFTLGYIIYGIQNKYSFLLYHKHLLVFIVLLLFVHYFIPVHAPKKPISIALISTDFDDVQKDDEKLYTEAFKKNEEKLKRIILPLASSSPSFVVLPEDTRFLSHLSDKEREGLTKTFPKTTFIDGDLLPTQSGYSAIALFYAPGDKKVDLRGKEMLLPFNEYIPLFFRPIFALFVRGDELARYEKLHTFTPLFGRKTRILDGVKVGTLICSEILSDSEIRSLKSESPDIVFFQSRLNVFHNNPWFLMHLRSFSKITASQLRTTLIGSTSGAPSFVVSPHGKFLLFTERKTGVDMVQQ